MFFIGIYSGGNMFWKKRNEVKYVLITYIAQMWQLFHFYRFPCHGILFLGKLLFSCRFSNRRSTIRVVKLTIHEVDVKKSPDFSDKIVGDWRWTLWGWQDISQNSERKHILQKHIVLEYVWTH